MQGHDLLNTCFRVPSFLSAVSRCHPFSPFGTQLCLFKLVQGQSAITVLVQRQKLLLQSSQKFQALAKRFAEQTKGVWLILDTNSELDFFSAGVELSPHQRGNHGHSATVSTSHPVPWSVHLRLTRKPKFWSKSTYPKKKTCHRLTISFNRCQEKFIW